MPSLENYCPKVSFQVKLTCQKLNVIEIVKARFEGIKGHLRGEEILESLDFDLIIKHKIKHIFVNKPTFEKYTEVDEVYRKLVNLSIPSEDRLL